MTMTTKLPDQIILGHNAFFGVNHLNADRGAKQASAFQDPTRIVEVALIARANGAGGMMMSTHERSLALCDRFRADPRLCDDWNLYPLLPYAQKYITAANEKGLVAMVMDAAGKTSFNDAISTLWQGGIGVLGRDLHKTLGALIRLELASFKGLPVKAVFLHDVLCDLILALKLRSVFEFYVEEIDRVFGCHAGLATKNLPALVTTLAEWHLPLPPVLTHFNASAFKMNPSREACEAAATSSELEIMAMGTLASGHIKPAEAYDYLAGVANIKSVVVGASSAAHIEETFSAISSAFAARRD